MTDRIQPGRELDIALAERMGQQHPKCTSSGMGGGGIYTDGDGHTIYEDWWSCQYCNETIHDNKASLCPAWPYTHYSTDWSAAGKVVERLATRGYTFSLRLEITGQWYCEWALGRRDWHCYSNSGPHAISLAALAALKREGVSPPLTPRNL